MLKFIYKNKIKILVILFFIVGVLLGESFNVRKFYYGFDIQQYEQSCRLFAKNENEALHVLKNINIEDTEESVKELENGMNLWGENRKILDNISRIENVTDEIKQKSLKLKEYCSLRVVYFYTLKINVEKGLDDIFDTKIIEIEERINNFLKKNDLGSGRL